MDQRRRAAIPIIIFIFYLIPIHLRVYGKIYLINRQMFENKEVVNEPEKIYFDRGEESDALVLEREAAANIWTISTR